MVGNTMTQPFDQNDTNAMESNTKKPRFAGAFLWANDQNPS